MTRKQLENWMKQFGTAWETRNPDKVMALFNDRLDYFESALKAPVTSKSEVGKLWQVVPDNQKDVKFSHKILIADEYIGVVNWQVSRIRLPAEEMENIDGIFLISLNDRGLCTFFKQWRTSITT
jgi:hypothetical protein